MQALPISECEALPLLQGLEGKERPQASAAKPEPVDSEAVMRSEETSVGFRRASKGRGGSKLKISRAEPGISATLEEENRNTRGTIAEK